MITRITLILVVFATLIGLALLADFELMVRALEAMPASTLALVIGVFLAGAILKGYRWAFYLRSARLDIRWRDGLTSFLAGMSTSPLPGGSWLAPRLAQEHGPVRMRQAAPALFVSFIVDAITVPSLVLVLLIVTNQPRYSYAIPIIGLTLGLVLMAMGRSSRVWNLVARLLSRTRLTRRWLPKERDIQMSVQALMRPRVLLGGVVFSIAATILSAAFLLLIVNGLVFSDITGEEALWIHSVSEAASIAIPIPGGFGVTDSSIAGMLTQHGIGFRRATFIALALRSFSTGFRVLFGSIVLFVRYDQFLLNALDFRSRTRKVYWRATGTPALNRTLAPVVNAVRLRLSPPVGSIVDTPPIEEATLSD